MMKKVQNRIQEASGNKKAQRIFFIKGNSFFSYTFEN